MEILGLYFWPAAYSCLTIAASTAEPKSETAILLILQQLSTA